MKRMLSVTALIALVAILSSCTSSSTAVEITFRGIPWGSSIEEVKDALVKDGLDGKRFKVNSRDQNMYGYHDNSGL